MTMPFGSGIWPLREYQDARLRSYFAPTAPTNVTATAGNGQASVTWTASTTIAQIPVTDYVVQYSSNSGSTWTTFSDGTSTSTSATVTGLTNGTAYTFRVAGVNGVGTGAYSTASSAVTPAAATDPNFSSVSLLLHMDGSGSSFVDSSGTPKTITANGDATQSTAQSKWGGKSAYFDGVVDAITISSPASSLINWSSQPFTVECWIYPTNLAASGPQASSQLWPSVCGNMSAAMAASVYWAFGPRADGTLRFYYWNGSSANTISSTSGAVSDNSWYHIAFTHNSGTIKVYLDGSEVAVGSISGTPQTDNSVPFSIGVGWYGYIDDFRVTAGVSRTVTVPTAAFPDS